MEMTMRKKIDTVQQLNDFLWNHKAVKAALREEASNRKRKSKGSKTKINSSNPKEWIRAATSLDPKIGALINATRRVCECQKEGRAQLRKKVLRKGKKTLDPKYLYKWAGIERDYHTMANLSYELIASNPLIAGFARAAQDIDDVHRFANPAFLDIP